ncbi:hypothetical protein AB0K60_26895 [Thermopolyspora sp. NPDC052614]|uniref:hypothetical protein n=1 Tax=Thermopolyspora sp. NPDC052614 TaxID=3155682 RepID=UPI0034395A63
MSKNAWSFGCRFVAAAALAIGASCAVTGTAAANDGGEVRTGCQKTSARSMGSTGPKGSAVSTGCRKRKKKDRRPDLTDRRNRYDRPSHGQWQEQRETRMQDTLGRLLSVQSLNLGSQSGGLPLADGFGFAASRGITRQVTMRLDPTLRTMPGWSSSSVLSPLPADGTILAGRVVNAREPQSALTAEVSTSVRTVTETTSKITRSDFGSLLSTADRGDLLTPASSMLGSNARRSVLGGVPVLR